MKAGIVINQWKLPIFSRHLQAAGFHYEQMPGPVPDTYLLTANFEREQQQRIAQVVLAANVEASKPEEQK
jgi:hypothetical protein